MDNFTLKDEENNEWTGSKQQTDEHILENKGNGKPIILRQFEFSLPPGTPTPTKDDILGVHKTKIMGFLWKDELTLIQEPKVVFNED